MPLRNRICLATVVACLPYLLLKVAWVAGWGVGVAEEGFDDTTRAANVVTAALELVAIAVAVLLVRPAGRRVPAVVVALPAWVATGLLVPVGAGAVLGALLQGVTGGGNAFAGNDVLAGWVYVVVYVGFAAQAALLLTGFVLHARERWPVVAHGGSPHHRAGGTSGLQRLLAGVLVAGTTTFAVQQVLWATVGGGPFTAPTTPQRVFLAVSAAAALAGAVATVGLLRGGRLTPARIAATWVGTAVPFSAAFLETTKNVAIDEGWGAPATHPAHAFLTLLVLLAALAGSVGALLRFADDRPATAAPSRAAPPRPTRRGSRPWRGRSAPGGRTTVPR